MELTQDALHIDGGPVRSTRSAWLEIVSPVTEQVVGRAPAATVEDVNRAVAAARRAFDHGPWPRMAVADRTAILRRALDAYRAQADEFAALVQAEMGCPTSIARAYQADYPAAVLAYHLDHVDEVAFEERRGNTLVVREPVGVTAAILAWNFPHAILMFKLAPALLAGCTVVVKPAPETAVDCHPVAALLEAAGVPPGVVNVVPADRDVSEALVRHPGVDKVAFTGSSVAGKRIGELCARDVRRCSLELGGKSAAIVLDDADLDATVSGLRRVSFVNSGQRCGNQTRILAPRHRYDEVVEALADAVADIRVGDPADPDTEVGPLVASRQRDRVEGYLAIGLEEGAKIVVGGGRPARLPTGWYVEPTVFRDVDNRMRIAQEEIFGPVVAVIPYDDDDHAVTLANDSAYGLSGSVWTGDVGRGVAIARRVRTGNVGINGADAGMDAPHGGFKQSGIGRELGPEGLLEYTELKTVPLPT